MIEKREAVAIVTAYLENLSREAGEELKLQEEATMEREFGWVFFYNSTQFIESGDFSDLLVGTPPLIVDRRNGTVHETGTAFPVEVYLDRYEKHGNVYPPGGQE